MSSRMTAAERRAFNDGVQAALWPFVLKKRKTHLCVPSF